MALKKLTTEQKDAMKLFRERRGGVNRAQQQANRANDKAAVAICSHLEKGPITVPELAAATSIAPSRVLWHIAAMRKYGRVREAGTDGDYVQYELAPEEEDATNP